MSDYYEHHSYDLDAYNGETHYAPKDYNGPSTYHVGTLEDCQDCQETIANRNNR